MKLLSIALLAGVLVATVGGTAKALPTTVGIQLYDPGTNTTLASTGTSPLTFSTAIGVFFSSINVGAITPGPDLSLTSLDIVTSGAGTLVIKLSANNITDAPLSNSWLSQLSGSFTLGATTVTLDTYIDTTNTLYGTPALGKLSSLTSAGLTPFSSSSLASLTSPTLPYAMTDVLTIVVAAATTDVLTAQLINQVPEPSTLALLGTGLIGAGFLRRRRA